MAFVDVQAYGKDQDVKIDVIFIPAIGADPKVTFSRHPDEEEDGKKERVDIAIYKKLEPKVHVLLYDHLKEEERGITVPTRRGSFIHPHDRKASERIHRDFSRATKELGAYGVDQWAQRLLETLRRHRANHKIEKRPIIFISHSTGGNVLKRVLVESSEHGQNEIASNTLAILFMAVPHHGSSVLSKEQYVREVQYQLRLKLEMSRVLRRDFMLKDSNESLEDMNFRFVTNMMGVKIYSFAETQDTLLTLPAMRGSVHDTVFRECVVDSRSGELGTAQVPVEDEEFLQLDLSHTELPRFAGQDPQYQAFLAEVARLVNRYDDVDRSKARKLKSDIMEEVKIHVHQFYPIDNQMKVLLAKPTLEDFLKHGPKKAMDERLDGKDPDFNSRNQSSRDEFDLYVHVGPSLDTPSVKVENTDLLASPLEDVTNKLTPPHSPTPKSIHTHRPPIPGETPLEDLPKEVTLEEPSQPKTVRFASSPDVGDVTPGGDVTPEDPLASMKLPDESTGFRWIHVPFTHPGWVHQILGRIARDKGNRLLHDHILKGKLWFSQHNQSRHASPHARFVRSSVKFLFPSGMENETGNENIPSTWIPSGCDDIQMVAYMPYLHYDSFANMESRFNVIKRRLQRARPIPPDVLNGKSTEHKLIWHSLMLERPLHCRRTLDQYGFPALRNTAARDHDQILWKITNRDAKKIASNQTKDDSPRTLASRMAKPQGSVDDGKKHLPKVLMVDQLWMWILDSDTVVTFFPGRENDNQDGYSRQGDVRGLIYQDINGDYASSVQDPYDFAALALKHAIRALLAKTSDQTLQIFRIFEEYISILTERQNQAWKAFRDNQEWKLKDIETEKHVNNRDDLNALLELRDIEDELNIVEKLLKEQEQLAKDMLDQYTKTLNNGRPNRAGQGAKGSEFLSDALNFLGEQQSQITSMQSSTTVAKNAYTELVDMKQKQANVLEARHASKQSQVATRQNRSVLIFTIFTIIFLPLSFLASVFGINSHEWNEDGTHFLHLNTIFTYLVCVSLVCIFIALIAALSSPRRFLLAVWRKAGGFIHQKFSTERAEDAKSDAAFEKVDIESLSGEQEADDRASTRGRFSTISRTLSNKVFGERRDRDVAASDSRAGSVVFNLSHLDKFRSNGSVNDGKRM